MASYKLAALVALASCSPLPSYSQPPSPIQYAVKTWTPDELRTILAEEKRLEPGNILITVLLDYSKTRAALKSCNEQYTH